MNRLVKDGCSIKRVFFIFIISSTLFLSNCGGGGGGDSSDSGSTPAAVSDTVLNVSFEPNRGNTCCSSSFAMVLEYYLPSVTFDDVYGIFGLPPFSADVWKEFESWAEGNLNMEMFTYNKGTIDDMIKCIDKGHPVVVLQKFDASNPEGHNRAVISYNSEEGVLILNDPSEHGPSYKMSFDLFTELWNYNGYGTTGTFYLIIPRGSENPMSGKVPYSWY
jgi:hypothetical protein